MADFVFFCLFLSLLTRGDAISCFDCQNVTSPHDCTKVTECNSDEFCFTQKNVMMRGDVAYNIGCLAQSYCSAISEPFVGKRSANTYRRATEVTACTECCNDNYCNVKGCGAPDIPFGQRGPYCYNCDVVSDPKHCKTVAVCQQNVICMAYSPVEFRDLPDTLFRSQCSNQSTCDELKSNSSTHRCAVTCCSTDFCNDECVPYLNTSTTIEATSTKTSMTTGVEPTTYYSTIPTENGTTKAQFTEETTLPTESHPPSTSEVPFNCRHSDGYQRIHNSHAQLCVHVVIHHATWDDARSACRHDGGDLVVLDTHAKALLMRHTLQNTREYHTHSSYWIGAKDISNNDSFYWINHHRLKAAETDWAKGQPSNNAQDCVDMDRDESYEWNDRMCSSKRSYICERN